jgi:hypothetical protein
VVASTSNTSNLTIDARNETTATVAAAAAAAEARAADAARADAIAEASRQATAAAAVAAAEAQAEVVAIMTAADAARAETIAEAKQKAQVAVDQAQADAAQIVAAAAAAAVNDRETAVSLVSASTQPASALAPASALPTKPLLPAASTTPSLLPDGKHAFLSYQWDVQAQVVQIKGLLNERNVKCWMDIDGGMKADIYDSVSIFPFQTPPLSLSLAPHSLAAHMLTSSCPHHPASMLPRTDGRGSAGCGVCHLFHDASVPRFCKLQFGAQVCPTIWGADCAGYDATELYSHKMAWNLDGRQHLDTDA